MLIPPLLRRLDAPGDYMVFEPLPGAASGWGSSQPQIRGLALSGAMAVAVEAHCADRPFLHPARWTIDLFRAAYLRPFTVRTEVIRSGRSILLVNASIHQDDKWVARATALFLTTADGDLAEPSGLWTGPKVPAPPTVRSEEHERVMWTAEHDWLPAGVYPQDDSRKGLWQFSMPLVEAMDPTPFQVLCGTADIVNAACSLGPRGMEFVNPDLSMTCSRTPLGTELGIVVTARTESRGIAAATGVIFDEDGPLGTVSASGLRRPPIEFDICGQDWRPH